MPGRTYNWWIATVPDGDWEPPADLPPNVKYLKGQKEEGAGGYVHWQVCVCLRQKKGTRFVRNLFGGRAHVEPTRSDAARDYVWKEDTRIAGSQFELGQTPLRRNQETDWEGIWQLAKEGKFEEIPPQVRICNYRSLRSIASDFSVTVGMERSCFVFWGRTGTGKSRRAWQESGMDAYSKGMRLLT